MRPFIRHAVSMMSVSDDGGWRGECTGSRWNCIQRLTGAGPVSRSSSVISGMVAVAVRARDWRRTFLPRPEGMAKRLVKIALAVRISFGLAV